MSSLKKIRHQTQNLEILNKALHDGRRWTELRHDKTNKMSVRSAKTQISQGIRPVWAVFALRSVGS